MDTTAQLETQHDDPDALTPQEYKDLLNTDEQDLNLESDQFDSDYFLQWNEHNTSVDKNTKLTCPILEKDYTNACRRNKEYLGVFKEYLNLSFDLTELNEDGENEPICDYSESALLNFDGLNRYYTNLKHDKNIVDNLKPFSAIEHITDMFLLKHNIPVKELYEKMDQFEAYYQSYKSDSGQNHLSVHLQSLLHKFCPRRPSILMDRLPEVGQCTKEIDAEVGSCFLDGESPAQRRKTVGEFHKFLFEI